MSKNTLFIAATGQNVGKTTLCLGMIAALKKKFQKVGFIKPVGQQHVCIENDLMVDKDAVLFREHFHLQSDWKDMSPVIIPSGFTRDYLDAKIDQSSLKQSILNSYQKIVADHDFTIVEGTGHVGVGSIIELDNVEIAKLLNLEMVIITTGGLGSAYDELALNLSLCYEKGVKVRGIILNRVYAKKRDMIQQYFPKALKKWGVPLIGCIPYNEFLTNPVIKDFEALFDAPLLSGKKHHYRHFQHTRLVAGSVDTFLSEMIPNELIITPASREDIIEAFLNKHINAIDNEDPDFAGGMILTGRYEPTKKILEKIRQVDIPVIYAPLDSYTAMKKITAYVAKIRRHDVPKIEKAIDLVEKHLDFEKLTD